MDALNTLKGLLDQARSWKDISLLLNEAGYPKSEYLKWQEKIKEVLRELPDAPETIRKFTRLQKHRSYSWVEDLGNHDTRLELVEDCIAGSIHYLERIIRRRDTENTEKT